jgi:hypothetical protein
MDVVTRCGVSTVLRKRPALQRRSLRPVPRDLTRIRPSSFPLRARARCRSTSILSVRGPPPRNRGGAASTNTHTFTLCPACPSSEAILFSSPSLGEKSTHLRTLSGRATTAAEAKKSSPAWIVTTTPPSSYSTHLTGVEVYTSAPESSIIASMRLRVTCRT